MGPPTKSQAFTERTGLSKRGPASNKEAEPPTEASLVSTDDQPVVTAVPVSIENLILVEEEKKRVRKGNKKVGFVLAL